MKLTQEEARKRAEEIVYWQCNLGDILFRCQIAGINTRSPKGKQLSRSVLEEKLIDHYIKFYSE